MAANTIQQLTTANTFQHWLTATQSLIGVANNLTNGAGDTFYANTRLEVGGTGATLNVVTSATIEELYVNSLNVLTDFALSGNVSDINVTNDAFVGNDLTVYGNTTIDGALTVSSLSGSGEFGTLTISDELTFNTATGNTLSVEDITFTGNLTGDVIVSNTNIEGVIVTDQVANGAITAEKLASGAALPATSGNATYFLTTDGTQAIWKAQTALELANVTVSSFSTTANGLVTSFNLGFEPVNEESLIVSLDGILQQPTSAYTVSGSTIEFSSAPSNTVNVVATSFYTDVATYAVEVAAGVQTTAENAYAHANGSFDTANSALSLATGTAGVANTDYTTISASAGVYGNDTIIPVITLASNGRVSAITNTAITQLGSSSDVQFNSFGVGTAGSGTTGEIRATNNITAYYSDKRLKTIKGNIDNALDKVMSLNGVYYENNEVAEKYGYINKEQQVGVLAQEVEQVLPEIVKAAPFDIGQNEDGTEYSLSGHHYKTVQYEKLVPLLLEAIKELKHEVNELRKNNV